MTTDDDDEQWRKNLERYNKRQAAKVKREPMPTTEEDAKAWIEQETYKCAWHSKGFSPARRCRLISFAKSQGWKY